MKNIIALVGPKHCGKSEAGRALAALTGGVFFDLDDEMQKRTGKSARVLYKEGIRVFQAAEREALEQVLALADGEGDGVLVLALGGGFIDNEAARTVLKGRSGCAVVFLSVSAQTAWNRIEAAWAESGELPAFLQIENPQAAHLVLHERRAAAYRGIASFVVDGENKTAEDIATDIVAKTATKTETGGIWESNTP
ncbi:MAG: shikimate kinase [Spirochaetaceae bacterium]|jgi:shikimate kinase|nr:shikimate kinase [Spirochaetaceae bacterium]